MILPLSIVSCLFVQYVETCLATQSSQNDHSSPLTTTSTITTTSTATTTTVATTTTTATEPPFPCSVCPKVYNPGCTGPGVPNWCAPAADVGLTYILGAVTALLGSGPDTCSTQFVCPFGTTSFADLFGLSAPGPNIVFAHCSETGPDSGRWFYAFPPSIPLPIPLKSLTCYGVLPVG